MSEVASIKALLHEIAAVDRGIWSELGEGQVSAEDQACAKLLFTLPCEVVGYARNAWQDRLRYGERRPLQDIYEELYRAVEAQHGAPVLRALRLPPRLQCSAPQCGQRLALSWPWPYDSSGALPGDDAKVPAVMEASQRRLELLQDPGIEDLRAVVYEIEGAQLALALFGELRGSVNVYDSLGFLHLLPLLSGDPAVSDVRASAASHVAFMRRLRREFRYRLAPETQQRVLKEMLQQQHFRPVDREAFLAIASELRPDLQPEILDDLRRFEAYNGCSRR
jgi:hypothetical protein